MKLVRALRCALFGLVLVPALAAADVVHICQATLLDGYGRPVAGARVEFSIETYDHPHQVLDSTEAFTGPDGRAALPLEWDEEEPVLLRCKVLAQGLGHKLRRNSGIRGYLVGSGMGAEVFVNAEMAPQWVPQSPPARFPGLRGGPDPDHGQGKARLYLSADGIYDRVVLIPQGMDFFEQSDGRTDTDELWFTFADALRALHFSGYDVWIFQPHLTGQNIHEQAAEFAQAIQYAAHYGPGASEGKVIVAGFSLGALVARVTAARWEGDAEWRAAVGLEDPSPIGLVALLDGPLRGANVNYDLQTEIWQGNNSRQTNLASCAAEQMIRRSFVCGSTCYHDFFTRGEPVIFPGAHGVCDSRQGVWCECEAGPPIFEINGDGFPHEAKVIAYSAGTWNPPTNLCYGDERDLNGTGQDMCPLDPGGSGPFAPQVGDHWWSVRWWVGPAIVRSQHFAAYEDDVAPGSRFTLAFGEDPRILDVLPSVPFGSLESLHNFSFTFIPITSALAADSEAGVPFEVDHWRTAPYQAIHNRPPLDLEWLGAHFASVYGGGGPGPGGYPPAAPGNVVADPVIGGWDQIDITWEDRSTNEDRFEVQRKRGASGSWEHVEFVPVNHTSLRDIGLQTPSGPGGTLFYFYRVIAHNGYGNAISNRAEAHLYSDPPGRPDTLRPRGCTEELLPTLSWRGGGQSTKFYVRLLDASTGEEAMPDVEVHENEVRAGRPLAARKPFMLRVWGMNNAGWGTGSAPEFFRTFCEPVDPPEWLEPVGCVDTLTPVARWTEVPDALSYHLRIYEMATIPGQQDQLVVDAGPDGESYQIPAGRLTAGKDYRAWVKPHTAGSSDPYSRIRFFTPLCGQATGAGFVSPISPQDAVVSTNRPEFVFEPASRADSYRLELYNETGTVLVYGRDYTAAAICGGDSCSARPDAELPPGRYAWWVRAGRGSEFDPMAIWSWVRVPTLPAVSVGSASANEAEGTLSFPVTLSAAAGAPVTVQLHTEPGSALEVDDYLPVDGQWTLPIGSTSIAVVVPSVDNAVHEATEMLTLRLSAASGALLGQQSAGGTIADDDPQPSLSIGDATILEGSDGSSTLELELSLTGQTALPVSARLETRDCSAHLGEDYLGAAAEQIEFAPGESSKSVKYSVIGDLAFEGDELFLATLSDPAGANLVDGWGQARIRNDDPRSRGDRSSQRPDADFDGNGRGDLLFRHAVSQKLSVWLLDGSDRIAGDLVQSAGTPNANWQVVGTGDLDRDGSTDLVWRNRLSGALVYWYLQGLVQISGAAVVGEQDLAWEVAGTGDFDQDQWVDLLWRHAESGELQIWRMQDQVRLERLLIDGAPSTDPKSEVAAIADFDGDADLDLLWRSESGELRLWLLEGTRYLGEQDLDPALLTDPNWRIAGAWDVDDDGWNDLVLQHAVSGRIVIWYLTANRRTCGAYPKPEAPVDARWQLTGLR